MSWVTLIAKYTLTFHDFLASEIPTHFRIFLLKQMPKEEKKKTINFILVIFY